MRISKSRFVAGVQCLKRLYFEVHQPELAEGTAEATQAVMEQGRQVGLMAQKAFRGGATVTADHGHLDEAIRVTRELVRNAEVPAIFEAAFEHGGVLVRADVLERGGRKGYRLIEVKSATGQKAHYAYDIGIQKHVLSGAGVDLEGTCLMYLNRDYVFDGQEYDFSRLFVVTEIDLGQTISDAEISSRVENQLRVLGQSAPPDVKPGRHCSEPVLCEFYDHCNPDLPSDHVGLLPRIRTEMVDDLLASGIAALFRYFYAHDKAIYELVAKLYRRITGKTLARVALWDLFARVPGWPLYLAAWGHEMFARAISETNYGRRGKPGNLDLWAGGYLPYCDVFVTNDTGEGRGGQYSALRLLSRLVPVNQGRPHRARILTYKQFKANLLFSDTTT